MSRPSYEYVMDMHNELMLLEEANNECKEYIRRLNNEIATSKKTVAEQAMLISELQCQLADKQHYGYIQGVMVVVGALVVSICIRAFWGQ